MNEQQQPPANEGAAEAPQDENKLIAERREKLRALRGKGIAFPNDFKPDAFAGDLQREYADTKRWTADALTALDRRVRVAGRIMARRGQGKVSFVQIQDVTGAIQVFAQANALGET
ncbi:MAG TPA: OB-fold nucleic acid binding domain-containing protein, partial [Rhodanobacteraceae bacterium]|nr:OB-fold nucleic acid binding domain-containing protein [Rhodanobacteraceae bacterium]